MVSKSTIKAYDFETIEDYYDYIVLSKINGQHGQVESLIKAMSKTQKKECLHWLNEEPFSSDHREYCKTILINAM